MRHKMIINRKQLLLKMFTLIATISCYTIPTHGYENQYKFSFRQFSFTKELGHGPPKTCTYSSQCGLDGQCVPTATNPSVHICHKERF